MEGKFPELRPEGVLGSLRTIGSAALREPLPAPANVQRYHRGGKRAQAVRHEVPDRVGHGELFDGPALYDEVAHAVTRIYRTSAPPVRDNGRVRE